MKIGVFGTGQVGSSVGRGLQRLGHDVVLGSRDPDRRGPELAPLRVVSFAEAAAHGEWVVNALPGEQSLVLLRDLSMDGKTLIDIANYDSAVDQPITMPLGEELQRQHPGVRLVKTLNNVSAHLMADPGELAGEHSVFIASNHEDAKAEVIGLLKAFGWRDILDLGDLSACRAMEQLIPLWMRLESTLGGPEFNLKVVRGHQGPRTAS